MTTSCVQRLGKRIATRNSTLLGTVLVAFSISIQDSTAQTPPPTVNAIYGFTGQSGDGANPYANVTVSPGGTLYGTTGYGGISGSGTVFALSPPSAPGGQWTESVLHSFTGADGAYPYAGVTINLTAAVLYGTTTYGGSTGLGTVFQLAPPAPGGAWTETVLYSFSGSDGANPYAGLAIGTSGALYGTTELGGAFNAGTVFKLTPPAAPGGAWTETVLYSFTGGADGGYPYGGLLIGKSGVLYGTTNFGGTSVFGTVFKLSPPAVQGGAWTESVVHSFNGTDGGNPYGNLSLGTNGVLYGTTAGGVGAGFGTVYMLSPPAVVGGAWTETVLYRFTGGSDGGHPRAGVSVDGSGALYGTAFAGGNAAGYSGKGVLFQLAPPAASGGAWTETVLYTFTGGANGVYPDSPLVPAGNGTYFGTALAGGTAGHGAVFSLAP